MAAHKQYWLMKCEPSAYSIEDLERDGKTTWEGVRNFQARNYIRSEMHPGDGVLFYASNAEPSGVSGIAEVTKEAFPDPFQFKKGHDYYDPKSTPDKPVWYSIEIGFVELFPETISLATLKETHGLESMVVTQKGSRLSIQPVTAKEFEIVRKLGKGQ